MINSTIRFKSWLLVCLLGGLLTACVQTSVLDQRAIDAAEIMEKDKIFSLEVNSSTNGGNIMGIITMHQLLEAGII